MSSDEEKEAFEVTDRDLLDELQPKPLYQSKNKATYGIWADESDEENAHRSGFGSKVPDYAASMNFVSGGVKGGNKMTGKDEEKEEVEDAGTSSDSEEEIVARTSSGASFTFSTGMRADSSFGNWEKYTKGIGAKLLQKMGHVAGKGLGKNAQGIINPIESGKQRKGRGTIGMYGSEQSQKAKMRIQQVDSEEEEDKNFQLQLNQWKKTDTDKRVKPKYIYKTAEEVLASGNSRKLAPDTGSSNVKVVDMTGREKRVMTGYRAISKRHDKPQEETADLYVELKTAKKVFDMPELMHNINMLVDMAEEDIIQNHQKLAHAKDVIVNLRYEQEKMSKLCECEEKQIEKLQTLVITIDAMNARISGLSLQTLEVDECAATFKYLKEKHPEEFLLYDIPILALAMAKPLMKDYLKEWQPLKEKRYGKEVMRMWKEVLHDDTGRYGYSDQITNPYDSLVWDIWMPPIRGIISNCNIRHCNTLIEFLEEWTQLLSPWIAGNILAQLVLPKLQQEVEKWDPLTDTVPIHAWIHPWLPLMSNKLEPVYEPIRLKLGNALRNWHPSDPSARLILQPWLTVFNKGHLDAFLIKHIVPKLHLCLSEFIINPHQQHLESWNWVMAWKDIIPQHTMVSLLDKAFFPKWHQILTTWLNANPNYEEIAKWFAGWKNMIPEDLAESPIIRDHFSSALNMMNRSVSGKTIAADLVRDASPLRRNSPPVRAPPPPPSSGVPQSFRELVERKAEEHCLLFAPVPNKLREGKQVYKFGKAQIYLDRNVIFVNDRLNSWIPVSLNTVVEYGSDR